MIFRSDNLPLHENGLTLTAWEDDMCLLKKTYYSVGGGFIIEEAQFGQPVLDEVEVPHPFNTARELLESCHRTGQSISGLVMKNELALHSRSEIEQYFATVWQTMQACIDRGLNTEGVLPGPLRVPRRASSLRRLLISGSQHSSDPMNVIDWVNMFALAVNEENAAGGRVVTAPTNGACGIIPAVLSYYHQFVSPVSQKSLYAISWPPGLSGSSIR